MSTTVFTKGIAAGRLASDVLADNFGDLHPPLEPHEALVASDRCYFCHDAPCMTACPTSIDIPLFIRQIATGTPEAAAKTILEANILGGMCARVCPTETLCEEVCVRETAEGKPVEIGRLQRYATDTVMAAGVHPFTRAEATGKTVAVVGAGPAGLSAAHRLAMKGHDVTIYDARPKAGGLNEYGIASYKTPNGFAQAEVEWLLKIGGITIESGKKLGDGLALDALQAEFDAVFLAIGLAGVNTLRLPDFDADGVRDAVDFISDLRQASDLSSLPVGRNVVVIGGGMTAVDAAVQSKLLGAQTVTMAYRRGKDRMSASLYEQELAATKGVHILTHAQPAGIVKGADGAVAAVEFDLTTETEHGLESTGETVSIEADQVLLAIGQTLLGTPEGISLERGKIAVDTFGRTSKSGIWAGGDCASGGDDLTVTAVAEGRDAAEDIHTFLMEG